MKYACDKAKTVKIAISLIFPILFLLVVWKKTGIYFETNDDKFITEILSGTLAGEPDGHTIYMNYLLSYPLSLLYRISAEIPWHGGMLVLCHFLVYAALLESCLSRGGTISESVLGCVPAGCCMLADFYITASIQYTSTAALMAVAGYACLLLQKRFQKGLAFFFFFELAAFLLRSQAMLMVQPIGMAFSTGFCLIKEKDGIKLRCRKACVILMCTVLVVGIGYVGNLIGYRGEGWDEYHRFNAARTEIFDYYDIVDYEDVKPVLKEYGVTKAEYEAFRHYIIMDWDVSAECARALAEFIRDRQRKECNIPELLKQVWIQGDSNQYLQLGRVSGMAWLAVFFWVLLGRRFCLLLPVGGAALSKTMVWGYLLYKGRTPLRVTAPLLVCEILLLSALLIREYTGLERGRKRLPVSLLFCLFCGMLVNCCISSGKVQYHEALRVNEREDLYMQGLKEVQEYCGGHSENRYLLDAWSFSYYRGSAFETDIYGRKNYVYTGGWFSNSPVSRQRFKTYLEGAGQGIYLILADEEGGGNYAEVYFNEKFRREPVLADRIDVSHGGSYRVLRYGGEE